MKLSLISSLYTFFDMSGIRSKKSPKKRTFSYTLPSTRREKEQGFITHIHYSEANHLYTQTLPSCNASSVGNGESGVNPCSSSVVRDSSSTYIKAHTSCIGFHIP